MENSAKVDKFSEDLMNHMIFEEDVPDFRGTAEEMIKAGYIHKSQACDYMERCPKCYGGTIIEYDRQRKAKYIGCHFCSGNGFVLKENV